MIEQVDERRCIQQLSKEASSVLIEWVGFAGFFCVATERARHPCPFRSRRTFKSSRELSGSPHSLCNCKWLSQGGANLHDNAERVAVDAHGGRGLSGGRHFDCWFESVKLKRLIEVNVFGV